MTTPRNAAHGLGATQVRESLERRLGDEEKDRLRQRRTPPKKWADKARTAMTPEYSFWYHEGPGRRRLDPTDEEQAYDHFYGTQPVFGGDPVANHGVYYPEEYDKDIGDGGWIFVIDPPRTELDARFKVPLLSLWWARPHVLDSGPMCGRLPYQAVIATPGGDLHLWPHEYMVCNNPAGLIGEEGSHLHSLGGQAVVDEDQLFYLMSRGLSRQEATILLLDQIEDGSAFGYVTFDEEIVEIFAGVGTTLTSHMHVTHGDSEVGVIPADICRHDAVPSCVPEALGGQHHARQRRLRPR